MQHRYRAIFISDLHLGTRGCQAELLLDFLARTESEFLYLVGDIIDGMELKRSWRWRGAHDAVLHRLIAKAHAGTQVIYVPGNHDDFARNYADARYAGIAVQREAVHVGLHGERLWIVHGDEYDNVVRYAPWLAALGSAAYCWAIALNQVFNAARRRLGYPYWSISLYLKRKVKNAVRFICDFERTVAATARSRGLDGVICGHIHSAELRDIDGVLYGNTGDWVESCSALVEKLDGGLEILHWAEHVVLPRRGAAGPWAPDPVPVSIPSALLRLAAQTRPERGAGA